MTWNATRDLTRLRSRTLAPTDARLWPLIFLGGASLVTTDPPF